eukprot:TRINITY_DN501_c4_g1_i1.p2 TRINITY_DN501_c4_g1~~TRINITY_DN501_c4_g1_i1.p2  ORF type:complete len:348 (-),score=136.89 TRINITY_DN501_c4_g1_i1:21-1064(-)
MPFAGKKIALPVPSSGDYEFKSYAPKLFQEIRQKLGISHDSYRSAFEPERFIRKLKSTFSEGKSGSFFCFSPCKNFILKTIANSEAAALRDILPTYVKYIKDNPKSLLIKIFGLHSLQEDGNPKTFVIVMSNCFNTSLKIHEKYDIKGSWVKRSVKKHEEDPSVLGKDQDLTRKMNLTDQQRQDLMSQVEADASFLESQGIMDYSLLLGFHFFKKSQLEIQLENQLENRERNVTSPDRASYNSTTDGPLSFTSTGSKELVTISEIPEEGLLSADKTEFYFIGMIDILQRWDLIKKAERAAKIYFLQEDPEGLSCQPVDIYRNRFVSKVRGIIEVPQNDKVDVVIDVQ